MKTTPTIIICAMLLCITKARVLAEDFYISDHGRLQLVHNADPNQYKVKWWKIQLYKSDTSHEPVNEWGCIFGHSIQDVQDQLKESQELEHWSDAHSTTLSRLTYTNPSAPIAEIDSDSTDRSKTPNERDRDETARRIYAEWEKVKELYETFNQIKEALSHEPKDHNPFEGRGNVVKEYFDNLTSAVELINKVGETLEEGVSLGAYVANMVQDAADKLNAASKAAGALKIPSGGNSDGLNADFTFYEKDVFKLQHVNNKVELKNGKLIITVKDGYKVTKGRPYREECLGTVEADIVGIDFDPETITIEKTSYGGDIVSLTFYEKSKKSVWPARGITYIDGKLYSDNHVMTNRCSLIYKDREAAENARKALIALGRNHQ